jgi:hypothetical protein
MVGSTYPIRPCRAVQFDALAGEDFRQEIQGKMDGIFSANNGSRWRTVKRLRQLQSNGLHGSHLKECGCCSKAAEICPISPRSAHMTNPTNIKIAHKSSLPCYNLMRT